MAIYKQEIINKIKGKIKSKWSQNTEVKLYNAINSLDKNADDVTKTQLRYKMRAESDSKFESCWGNVILPQINSQMDLFAEKIISKLLARHPWLSFEEQGDAFTLIDIFLVDIIEKVIFDLLEKSSKIKDWSALSVDESTILKWNELDVNTLSSKIEGFPLSKSEFYEDRRLPTFLNLPVASSPKRYDIYRLLKNKYSNLFKPTLLSGNVYCTKIAPLHYSELSCLSATEWNHFNSIILNIGEEDNPIWVLLDKKNDKWNLYISEDLEQKYYDKCSGIEQLKGAKLSTIVHHKSDNIIDWNAVCLSRILPWTQLPEKDKPSLEMYRSSVPVSILLQNTIEETCLNKQAASASQAIKAFSLRYPLTNQTLAEIYTNKKDMSYLLTQTNIPTNSASIILEHFDKGLICYSVAEDLLTINDNAVFFEAMQIAYHNSIGKLDIKAKPPALAGNWFTYNLDLTNIISPNDPKDFGYLHACAARNRFIKDFVPTYLASASNEIAARKAVWENTGKYIYEYFNSRETLAPVQLKNIAEMGKEGLDTFFTYLNSLDAPNLTCALDLNSGNTLANSDYIKNLSEHVDKFKPGNLFKKLELILPDKFDITAQNNFFGLLKSIHLRHELENLTFNNTQGIDDFFLDELKKYVEFHHICVQIIIPEWDAVAFGNDKNLGKLKAKYRLVQNTILSNIRENRQNNLEDNTDTIYRPEEVIALKSKNSLVIDPQQWRPGIQFQLATASVGVQQQAQQEIAQEAQQKNEKQSKAPSPVKREKTNYPHRTDNLITRANLSEHGISLHEFSNWVGSSEDALYVIQKLDKSALLQIRKFPEIFNFGIDPDRTPGFRLYYTSDDDKSLILSFDETLVERDIFELKDDAFALRMNDCKKATEFLGDFRQFEPLVKLEVEDQITSWHHLSVEAEHSIAIKSWLKENTKNAETSETLQCFNCTGQKKLTKDFQDMLGIIKNSSSVSNKGFVDELLSKLNAKNLKAFGQLFYHYGEEGNKRWLELVSKIYERFPDKLAIFKERLLEPLNDWSECLEQSEVESLTACIIKLKDQPIYSAILWELIDKHGQSVGRMRFAEVWRGYEKVIDYINANDLEINQAEFIAAINGYGREFNATQFLRRIFEVLQATANRQDSESVQQDILNNMSKIDWRESGFYYACVHENYRYWDEDLKLNDLDSLNNSETNSYIAVFDDIDLNKITDAKTYTLRYVAQHVKLNKKDFNTFKSIINRVPANPNLLRLISASIAIGQDSVENLGACEYDIFETIQDANIYNLVNKHLRLDDKDLKSSSYQVQIADLSILLKSLNQLTNIDLNAINALGRALQSYKQDEKAEKLGKLIKYAQTRGFDSPLFTSFPWLIDDPIEGLDNNPEQLRFYTQLQTIDFKNSTLLPDKNTLNNFLIGMMTVENRRSAIRQLINSGCKIIDQDAEYRVLNNDEKKFIDELYLAKTFKQTNLELLRELFEHLAVKQGEQEKIKELLVLFGELDRKSHYNELGQVLGLLIEKSKGDNYYSVAQLKIWLSAVFDENAFKENPYPVTFIKELLNDALKNNNSSLISNNLHNLKSQDEDLQSLEKILQDINLKNLNFTAKDTLAKTAIKLKKTSLLQTTYHRLENVFNNLKHVPVITSECAFYINKQLIDSFQDLSPKINVLEKLAAKVDDSVLRSLWENNQFKIFEKLNKNLISIDDIEKLLDIKDPYARMIILAAFTDDKELKLVSSLQHKIANLAAAEKEKLTKYYGYEPKPSLDQLSSLLSKFNNAQEIINNFERVILPKRYYSLSAKDAKDILRVLNGITVNKQPHGIAKSEQTALLRLLYYANNFCQVAKLHEKSDKDILELIESNKNLESQEAKARVLACIREIIARKTGKWIKHTQMIALIYSALHNDESLLHQIHMGEGKSIIGVARDVYLALHGEIVDVFSSKESLSVRDHIESKAVLDAFGIRNAHITASSKREEYHDKVDSHGLGAVHYATISLDLFYDRLPWEHEDKIDLFKNNRTARCDEGDYVMRSENTLLNFSDQGDSKAIYNYDAWVYHIAYEYYLENQNKFLKNNLQVFEDDDLKNLYKLIEDGAKTIAPNESNYFRKYLATGDKEERNSKLVDLLTSAHIAQNLEEGVDFCVVSEQKKISENSSIDTRFAKVMINNQIYHDSTFFKEVHIMLHERLNVKAIKQHETPNFFIMPECEIALTSNAKFMLKNYYNRIEAMTGTAGSQEAVKFYKDEFGINRVVKYPTHEEIKTKFEPPIYALSELSGDVKAALDNLYSSINLTDVEKNKYSNLVDEFIAEGRKLQIERIVESINLNTSQPILITCEDDKEVEILGALIVQALGERVPAVVIDTNAKCKSEHEILKNAGIRGAITISSRLGRGSDIDPYDRNSGLKVLRTYPATPEVVKQEEGRQGRNGAGGTCQDIINYNAVLIELAYFEKEPEFIERLDYERQHLVKKLHNHKLRNTSKPKWEAIKSSEELKEHYLKTRTLAYVKEKRKNAAKDRMARKDNLVIEGSAAVKEHLYQLSLEEQENLKRSWKLCRREIEIHWEDNENCLSASQILNKFYSDNQVQPLPKKQFVFPEIIEDTDEFDDASRIEKLIAFHQAWLVNLSINNINQDIIDEVYGIDSCKLDNLYLEFHKLTSEELDDLSKLIKDYNDLCHRVSCNAWSQAINFLIEDRINFKNNLPRITNFFNKNNLLPKTSAEVREFSQKFITAVEGAPDLDFILSICKDLGFDESIVSKFTKEIVYLCKHFMNEEDIIFLINTLHKTKDPSAVLDYLKIHFNELKINPTIIRPIIPLIASTNTRTIIENLDITKLISGILRVLSKRLDFDAEDFEKFKAKIERIIEPQNKNQFLVTLATIPPYISIKSILKDLSELPSYNFTESYNDLIERIKLITKIANNFNQFLFDNDIINSITDPIAGVLDVEAFKTWQEIYLKMPLDKRNVFFEQVIKINSLSLDKLQDMAKEYTKNSSNKFNIEKFSVFKSNINENKKEENKPEQPSGGLTSFFRKK